jgi:hypothetical protein
MLYAGPLKQQLVTNLIDDIRVPTSLRSIIADLRSSIQRATPRQPLALSLAASHYPPLHLIPDPLSHCQY